MSKRLARARFGELVEVADDIHDAVEIDCPHCGKPVPFSVRRWAKAVNAIRQLHRLIEKWVLWKALCTLRQELAEAADPYHLGMARRLLKQTAWGPLEVGRAYRALRPYRRQLEALGMRLPEPPVVEELGPRRRERKRTAG